MPSSLLRAGIAALATRSRGVVAALTGSGGAGGDVIDDDSPSFGPLAPDWLVRGHWAPAAVTDVRRLLLYAAACVMILVLVALTSPTENSFRAYLTELAFRRHLAHIRSSDDPEADYLRNSSPTTNGSANSNSKASTTGGTGADTPPIAPFRFANHVAISLRTPSLCYQTYFFFAIAFSAAPGPPAFLSDPVPTKAAKKDGPPQPEPALVHLGILGHWFLLGQVPALLQWAWRLIRVGRRDKARKKSSALDRPGVLEMRAVLPNKDESAVSAATSSSSRPSALVPKLLFKTESLKDLTDLLPLHSHSHSHSALQTPPNISPQSGTLAPEPRSRRGSIVNLIATPPTPSSLEGAPAIEVSSPVLTALKAELAAAQSVLAELEAQLTTHDESVAASQAHLQSTLDELRSRRKEDDAERQDLKSKTKTLDDQKRQAEGARRESEKRLKAAEAVRDALQAKIAQTLGEIEDLKGNMQLSRKNVDIVHDEAAAHVIETANAVEDMTKQLGILEAEVVEVEESNDTLSQRVKDAEDKLKSAEVAAVEAHKMAPEEEMMLMAAAYEAAASETYLHGQRQNQADSQWASQAAAYMAEAGFPHLDQSYTARPTQAGAAGAGGYGHLARAHPNNASYRSLVEKNIVATASGTSAATDRPVSNRLVSGFEDFGPGASRSLARPTTPSIPTDDEDQGSVTGPMSNSFPDSWLPQGLVRSLEGDITPLEGGSEVAPSDDEGLVVADVFETVHGGGDNDSGSDSDLGSPRWPTSARELFDEGQGLYNNNSSNGPYPGPRPRRVTPTSRLLPNSMNGSASTLPGMAPSTSRRWFSTSPSSENVSSSFNLFNTGGVPGVGSSDSLPLGFESPFAPSASEKRALKWPLLGKARWGTNGNTSSLDEIAQNLKADGQLSSSPRLDGFGSSPPARANGHGFFGNFGGANVHANANGANANNHNALSAEELFNRVPPAHAAADQSLAPGGRPWLPGRGFGGGRYDNSQPRVVVDEEEGVGMSAGFGGSGGSDAASLAGSSLGSVNDQRPAPERKPSFRFFSLRKGA